MIWTDVTDDREYCQEEVDVMGVDDQMCMRDEDGNWYLGYGDDDAYPYTGD